GYPLILHSTFAFAPSLFSYFCGTSSDKFPRMFEKNSSVAERLMRYVKIDTTTDPDSPTQPSSETQKDMCRLLVAEWQARGASDAELDEHGYVYATVPVTAEGDFPVLCLCAHVDTSPDCSGTNVKPILHKNYDGLPISLPDDPNVVITTDTHPYLKEKIGDD